MFDVKPVILNIGRWQFDKWAMDMLDKSELEGNKVELHKIRANAPATEKKPTITITKKEKDILDTVARAVSRSKYILEKYNTVKGCSKSLVQKTVKNDKLLGLYKLKRIRANKNIKEKLGITDDGYPFIILRGEDFIG